MPSHAGGALDTLKQTLKRAKLTNRQKDAVWCLIADELTTREAAKRMGCSQPNVVQHFTYACRKIPSLKDAYRAIVSTRTRTAKTADRIKRVAA